MYIMEEDSSNTKLRYVSSIYINCVDDVQIFVYYYPPKLRLSASAFTFYSWISISCVGGIINYNETSKLISQRENYITSYTIVSGNKPSSVALHQNHTIVFKYNLLAIAITIRPSSVVVNISHCRYLLWKYLANFDQT